MKKSYIILLFLILTAGVSCTSKSQYGKEYNHERQKCGGQIIDYYLTHNFTSYDKTRKEGMELWIIDPEKEKDFRSSQAPYHNSKFIYFNEQDGAFQEKDLYRKVLSKNREYQITALTLYDHKKNVRWKVSGFLLTIDHGQFIDSLEIELDKKQVDSLLRLWKLN